MVDLEGFMTRIQTTRFITATAWAFFATFPNVASAQAQITLDDSPIPLNYSRDRNTSVLERDRPEVDPVGVPLGGFTLFPRLDLGVEHTDNVFQNNLLKKSDTVFDVVPTVTVNSNWGRHAFNVSGGGFFQRYSKNSIRDQDGWNVNAGGRLDISSSVSLFASAGTGRYFQDGYSGENIAALGEPIPYQRTVLNSRLQLVRGRFRIIGAVDYIELNYMNSVNLAGNTVISDNRDRNNILGTAQIEYGVSPDTSVFIKLSYADTVYDFDQAVGVANRDSQTRKMIGGVTFDISSLVRGTLGVGYSKRKFDSPLYLTSSGISYEGQVEWFLSPLTTVTISAKRQLRDSAIPGSSDFFETQLYLRADHELLRNLLLRVQTSYSQQDYRGIISKAEIFRLSGGARYLINRNFALDFDLSHGKRSSNGIANGSVFSENRADIALTGQL
jgi:hypothetical protein